MWPYYLLIGVPAIIGITYFGKTSKKANRIILTTFFVMWLLLLMLRSESVGTDIANYGNIFKKFSRVQWKEVFSFKYIIENEFGLCLISKIIQALGLGYRALLVFISALSLIPLFLFYRKKITNNAYLSISIILCIGIFPMYFSGLRQVVAIALVIPAYYFVRKRRFVFFLLIVLLAFLFHKSAVIIVLLYPAYYIKLKSKGVLIGVLGLTLVLFIFREYFFLLSSSLFSNFYEATISQTGAFATLALLLLFLVFSFIIPEQSKLTPEIVGLRNILILCCWLQVFASVNFLAMRMNYYFLIFVPILITKVIAAASYKTRRTAELSVVIMSTFFTVYFFYDAYFGGNALKIFPYLFFWEQ